MSASGSKCVGSLGQIETQLAQLEPGRDWNSGPRDFNTQYHCQTIELNQIMSYRFVFIMYHKSYHLISQANHVISYHKTTFIKKTILSAHISSTCGGPHQTTSFIPFTFDTVQQSKCANAGVGKLGRRFSKKNLTA